MSIYLTGDTHIPIDIQKLGTKQFPEQKMMTRNDYVVILGDFGLYWHEDKEYYWWRRWLKDKKFTILWIDGNHENHEWIDSMKVSEWNGGKVHQTEENIIHLMRGQIYTIDGKTFFTFGGASSYDKEQRREGISWWAREEASYAEQTEGLKNLEAHNWKIDYILTHTCPKTLIPSMFKAKIYENNPTENYLDYIAENAQYNRWYFGHWHQSKDNGKFTVLYNTIEKIRS